eukprot:666225-Amphidinium_carterae.1
MCLNSSANLPHDIVTCTTAASTTGISVKTHSKNRTATKQCIVEWGKRAQHATLKAVEIKSKRPKSPQSGDEPQVIALYIFCGTACPQETLSTTDNHQLHGD